MKEKNKINNLEFKEFITECLKNTSKEEFLDMIREAKKTVDGSGFDKYIHEFLNKGGKMKTRMDENQCILSSKIERIYIKTEEIPCLRVDDFEDISAVSNDDWNCLIEQLVAEYLIGKPKCEYTKRECDLWDEECLAVFPEQCPYNDKKDVEEIKRWQRKIIENAVSERKTKPKKGGSDVR